MVAEGLVSDRLALRQAGFGLPDTFELSAVTPPARRAALISAVSLVLVATLATPLADLKMLMIPGYMTAFGSAMIIINLLLSALLFSKGAIQRRGDATRLGVAYLFVGIIFIPMVASFPGGIMPGSVIGTAISSVWLWSFWHAGFGLCIIRYAWFAARPAQRPASLKMEMAVVIATIAVLTVLSTCFLHFLPTVLGDGHTLFSGASGSIPVTILMILAVALVMVCRLRGRTPEELWLVVALVAAIFDVWLTYRGSDRFSLGWYFAKCGSVVTSLVVLLTSLHEVTQLYSRAAEANAVLTNLAQQDGLTGLCNRRYLDEIITMECRRGQRNERFMSLLMIDVDHFKKFNDYYGHLEGDACLRQVAALLQTCTRRPDDTAARYGGEEFVLLLPNTDTAGAMATAERLQKELRALACPHASSPFGIVTLSIGLASTDATSNITAMDLLAEADRALYRAKASGRDQISLANDALQPDGVSVLVKFLRTPQASLAHTPALSTAA